MKISAAKNNRSIDRKKTNTLHPAAVVTVSRVIEPVAACATLLGSLNLSLHTAALGLLNLHALRL